MKRYDDQRLTDGHLTRGALSDGLVFDAIRLLGIGEAVKAISPSLLATGHAIVTGTVNEDLEPLLAAVHRLQARAATKP